MLEELYQKLDMFRDNITPFLDESLVRKKEAECNITFPEAMVDFYVHFGNDTATLSSFYHFVQVDDIRVEFDALTFGENHQGNGRLGITLKDLSSPYKSVCWYSYEREKWFSEGAVFPESFFFNIACWQVMNTMQSIVRVHVTQEEYVEIVNKYFRFFSNEKKYVKGYNIASIYSDCILGCYVKDDEYLYLATNEDDDILNQFEEKTGLDFDWL